MDQDRDNARKRAKLACSTCKVRRRKCDGQQPCGICLHYGRECSYDPLYQIRTQFQTPAPKASRVSSRRNNQRPKDTDKEDDQKQETMEANAGTVFPYLLGRALNPTKAPGKNAFGWNLGLGWDSTRQWEDVTSLLSKTDMQKLAEVYFDKVHPVYGFIDRDALMHKVLTKWNAPSVVERYDAVLFGVAALGSLFSGPSGHERQQDLAQAACDRLELTSTTTQPMQCDAAAWLLRTIYLRATSPPHAAWMASCVTMHVIEATGAHQEPDSSSVIYPDAGHESGTGREFQRRLFWVGTVLNTWISNEYGRSHVVIRGVSCRDLSPVQGNLTSQLVKLYRVSELLDPDNQDGVSGLIDGLSEVENLELAHDTLVLSQTNLAIAIYRRLRASRLHISNDTLSRVIRMGMNGLEAAVRMAEDYCPWWHVANVPFQFVCVLVVMETQESLSQVGHALQALGTIALRFGTRTIQAALHTAEHIVRTAQKKKSKESEVLERAIDSSIRHLGTSGQVSGPPGITEEVADPWGGPDDIPDWNWDDFLSMDIPVFGEFGLIEPISGTTAE